MREILKMAEPVYKLKNGTQNIAVFENYTYDKNGKPIKFYSLQIQRSYKNKDDEWQRQTISEIDERAFVLADLIKKAAMWCVEHKQD